MNHVKLFLTCHKIRLKELELRRCFSKLAYLLHSENIRQHCKSNKVKIIAPTWNDEFELPNDYYSVAGIQNYIE